MTLRVDTLDAILTGSSSRALPALRRLTEAASIRLMEWWHQRSAMVMSDEWMHEYRLSNRDRD
jgi:hypothetical protein